tara:strand:+ start:228 stop:632 length:405 start_codon:yes stop_codon:yes gene_type:complete
MRQITNSIKPVNAAILWSTIGALLLIFVAGERHHTLSVVPIYATILIAAIVTVQLKRPTKLFQDLFLFTLATFSLTVLIDYIYIINIISPEGDFNFFDHAWRVAILLGIGTAVSLFLTFLMTFRKSTLVVSTDN